MLSSRFVPSTKGMIIKMKISNTTLKFLEKSGWNSCRNIDITIYQEAHEAEGYKLSNIAEEFLKQFGGIEIVHPAFRVPNAFDKTHFDPIKAIRAIYRGNVEEYEERVGESMVLIGEAYNRHLVLLMSESGKIYGAYDDYLTKLGDNSYEALNALCESKETPEV
jgi:hypothetical protein